MSASSGTWPPSAGCRHTRCRRTCARSRPGCNGASAPGLRDWKRIDSAHLRTFAARSHAAGLQPRSIQRRLSALRTFFSFLVREGLLKHNPAVDVRAPKAGKRLPHTLDVDQMGALLALKPQGPLGVRDLAMMELLYSSGLRLAELVSLNLADLHLAGPHRAGDRQGQQDPHHAGRHAGAGGPETMAARTHARWRRPMRTRCSSITAAGA